MTTETDDFLEHYGVMGMRWGKHSGGKSTSELKSLDKAAKKKDNAKRNAQIDGARARYKASARSNYKAAKAQYKVDKYNIGKHEAKKAFQKVKDKNIRDADLANQTKSGKETVVAMVALGALSAAYIGLAAMNARS